MQHLFLILVAFGLGTLGTFQIGFNSTLAGVYGSTIPAALTNTIVASLCLAVVLLVFRVPVPFAKAAVHTPWWGWLGGVLGATLVLGSVIIGPKLGAASYFAATVTGAMIVSLVADHFGLMTFAERPANLWRLAGGAMVIGGMLMLQNN